MKSKELFFTALFLLISVLVVAQNDFREGYIIDNNNDTTFGFVEYRADRASSKICGFKKNIEDERKKYTPKQLKAYRITDGKYYVSRIIDDKENAQPIFLEFIINGIVDIFYYRDELGEHYLIEEEEGKLLPLRNDEREFYVNGVKYKKRSTEYKQVLKHVFRESPSASKRAENLPLNHKYLINITNDYHNEVCEGEECIIYEKKVPNIKFVFGPVVGISIFTLYVNNDEMSVTHPVFVDSDFGTNVYSSFGIFMNNSMPKFNDHMSLQIELTYAKWDIKTTNIFKEYSYGATTTHEIRINNSVFDNVLMMRYTFPIGKLNPVVFGGGFFDLYLSSNYTHRYTTYLPFSDTYQYGQNLKVVTKDSDSGLLIGAGIDLELNEKRNLFFDLRYKKGFGLIDAIYPNYYEIKTGINL